MSIPKIRIALAIFPTTDNSEANLMIGKDICERQSTNDIKLTVLNSVSHDRLPVPESVKQLEQEFIEEGFKKGTLHEVWLYGKHISEDMWVLIRLARRYGIHVLPRTQGTDAALYASTADTA